MSQFKMDYYHAARKWLYSLITDPQGERFNQKKSLLERRVQLEEQVKRISLFLEFIGNPQNNFNSVHIAGTSGKGSVTSFISSLLYTCGFKTADHTSPYLQVVNEKLRLNNTMISPHEFAELISLFKQMYNEWIAKGNTLAYTEAWVALTFIWFDLKNVDWAVTEASMGGRFDPTVVLPSNLSVITNVNFDHTGPLGTTLKEIAWHKAGIIKKNSYTLTAESNSKAFGVIAEEARKKNSNLFRLIYKTEADGTLTVKTPHRTIDKINKDSISGFNIENIATAITAVDILSSQYRFDLNKKNIEKAISDTFFPGRMEILQDSPIVIIDAAHNPHKIEYVVNVMKNQYYNKKISCVVGFIQDKNTEEMLISLSSITSNFIVAEPKVFGKPAQSINKVAAQIKEVIPNSIVKKCYNLHQYLFNKIKTMNSDEILFITGSIYLIGEAREYWYPSSEILRSL
ncbi:MAG: hypothetical protein D3907_01885 [Candidatus Electrothrix sp. AUS3]|nr:hypothetical protein [Candidatus Electrothrix gigas]